MTDLERVRDALLRLTKPYQEDWADVFNALDAHLKEDAEREVLKAEAWNKARAWHRLLQGQVCVYCREPLLSAAGPPCQHQKYWQEASQAHADAIAHLKEDAERDREREQASEHFRAAMAELTELQEAVRTNECCTPGCGSLAWTQEKWGRLTHKHTCKRRVDPWCQTHPEGCQLIEEKP